jgi:hypothetical protein
MKKLLDLGFKKVPTEPGFHMYELTPARLDLIKVELKKILKTNREARDEKRASLQARKRTSLTSK